MKNFIFVFLTFFIILLSPLRIYPEDWPQLGHDPQRTNRTSETVGEPTGNDPSKWPYVWQWSVPDQNYPIAIRTQPVAAEGVVAVGTHDGKIHCIDFANGTTRWSYQTGGAILHSCAISNGKIYATSHDGKIYAINISGGNLAWSYQTGMPIIAAPLIVSSNVYVGSKDGVFYAINGATGALMWQSNIGEPIVTAAAYSANANMIFFGTAKVKAYGINFSNGNIVWSRQLNGQCMQEAWPQVSESNNLVIFRVLSCYDMWNNINHAGRDLENIGGSDFDSEQTNASNYLKNNPYRRTFYGLNTSNGQDKYSNPEPVLWTWGVSSTMHPQAIDDANGICWVTMRTKYQPTLDTVDTGRLNLATGRFETHPRWNYVDTWGIIMPGIPADEPRPISAAGDTWFTQQFYGPSGCHIPTGKCFTTCAIGGWMEIHDHHDDPSWGEPGFPGMQYKVWIRGFSTPIWTNSRLIWNAHGGLGCKRKTW